MNIPRMGDMVLIKIGDDLFIERDSHA
jgi:hypothetical protein